MLSKNQIKHIQSLRQKKFRNEENLFIAEGVKIVNDMLASSFEVKAVYASKDWDYNVLNKAKETVEFEIISDAELAKISDLHTPNQVLALVKIPSATLDVASIKNELSIALDDVQDPGNLGTIIRLANWFGIKNIICSPQTVDAYNSKVVQATMGAICGVNIFYEDLKAVFEATRKINLPLYATTLDGENIYIKKLSTVGIILMGNEAKGVSKELLNYVNEKLFIPTFNTELSKTESLNVAVSAAIVCSEFRRRV